MSLPMCLCGVLLCIERDYIHGIYMCEISLAQARKCITFSMNEKMDLNIWNFLFMKFYIGGHLLKLYGATS